VISARVRPLFGAAAIIVALAALSEPAKACSCADSDGLRGEALMSARLQKAQDVVRGKFVALAAGHDVVREGRRLVIGRLQIDETLKGDLKGEIEVVTGFGTGDCGSPSAFLFSIAWDRQVDIEIRKTTGNDPLYAVDICGYGKVLPAPTAK